MTFEENGIFYIRGIVSSTPSTQSSVCDSMEYSILTDVAQYLTWIRDTATIECETKVRCEWGRFWG